MSIITTSSDYTTHQVFLLALGVGVCADHEPHGLVKHVYLMHLQVLNRGGQVGEQLADERLRLANLSGVWCV